jgi:phage replication O-like protein O
MADVQLENGFARIANELLDEWVLLPLSGREFRILIAIVRKTYGFGKKQDILSISQISEMTGIDPRNTKRVVRLLVKERMITRDGMVTAIQKDHDLWRMKNLVKKPVAIMATVANLAVANLAVAESGKGGVADSATHKRNNYTKEKLLAGEARETWMTPFADAWKLHHKGILRFGRWAKALSELVKEFGTEKTVVHFGNYIASEKNTAFLTPEKFSETFGQWEVAHGRIDGSPARIRSGSYGSDFWKKRTFIAGEHDVKATAGKSVVDSGQNSSITTG